MVPLRYVQDCRIFKPGIHTMIITKISAFVCNWILPVCSRRTHSALYTHRVAQTSALFLLKLWYYSNFFALYLFLSKKFYLFPHAALFSNANKVCYILEFGITICREIKINSGTYCRYVLFIQTLKIKTFGLVSRIGDMALHCGAKNLVFVSSQSLKRREKYLKTETT